MMTIFNTKKASFYVKEAKNSKNKNIIKNGLGKLFSYDNFS